MDDDAPTLDVVVGLASLATGGPIATKGSKTQDAHKAPSKPNEHELGDARLEVYIRSFLAALERNYHGGEKELKGELGRDAGEKKHNRSEEKPLVLTFELVSQYFCMPIKRAAEELNVGLTILKKRCREIGIPRWPHRKVKSLETLIKNAQPAIDHLLQELGKPMIEVEMLQRKKKLIEESPGHIELDEATMVLRQACFKEKFKRRRLMAIEG
ncbi:protein RKD1-like [Hordeum vulgare]|nr:protein RKD1-like [Hordeum vulgare]